MHHRLSGLFICIHKAYVRELSLHSTNRYGSLYLLRYLLYFAKFVVLIYIFHIKKGKSVKKKIYVGSDMVEMGLNCVNCVHRYLDALSRHRKVITDYFTSTGIAMSLLGLCDRTILFE